MVDNFVLCIIVVKLIIIIQFEFYLMYLLICQFHQNAVLKLGFTIVCMLRIKFSNSSRRDAVSFTPFSVSLRSEERRVGKECSSRWWRDRGNRKRNVGTAAL